jgi:hypothetical protein
MGRRRSHRSRFSSLEISQAVRIRSNYGNCQGKGEMKSYSHAGGRTVNSKFISVVRVMPMVMSPLLSTLFWVAVLLLKLCE